MKSGTGRGAGDYGSRLTREERRSYEQILEVLGRQEGVDFSAYKESTLLRRVMRRAGLARLDSMEEYRKRILASETERRKLYQDILAGVTEFFRDEDAFRSLYEKALVPLLDARQEEVRIWSIGCGTGEEAYSLAMLVYEYQESHSLSTKATIFATDIDGKAIAYAQRGVYPEEAAAKFPQEKRNLYFIKEGNSYRVRDDIRKYVVFACHNVLRDAPFKQVGLIVCRNLFIYLKQRVQLQLQEVFSRQLTEHGFLFLGSSESAAAPGGAFREADKKWRIYQKIIQTPGLTAPEPESTVMQPWPADTQGKMEEERYIGEYEAEAELKAEGDGGGEERILKLEQALRTAREELRNAVEELEYRNELLQVSNEKMLAVNEELKNSNEEVQCINEELKALNLEYQIRNEELTKSNADFDNLLQNAEVGALYIDRDYQIRKLTPIIEQTTSLFVSDVGKSARKLRLMKGYYGFAQDVARAMEQAEIAEREVYDADKRIWLIRIRPYYDARGRQDGVLVTMFDITKRLEASIERARAEKERLDAVVKLTADLIFEYDIQNDEMYYYNQQDDIANPMPVLKQYTEKIGDTGLIYEEDMPVLEEFCRQLKEGKDRIRLELRKRYSDGKYHWIAIKARSIRNDAGEALRVVGKTIIVDERKRRMEELKEQSEHDSMTGLYNAGITKRLITGRVQQNHTSRSYLVVVDVDDFKRINDTMGHLFGDAVLMTFADELRSSFPDGIAGRMGGDEFVLYLEGMPFEEIIRKLERMNTKLHKAYRTETMEVTVSCSAGIAACKPGVTYRELIRQADSALYYVKRGKKGTAKLYEASMQMIGKAGAQRRYPVNSNGKEMVIQEEDDLILFALEMFEKVPDIKSAIRAISDRICRYYQVQDIMFMRPDDKDGMRLIYHWGRGEAVHFYPQEISVEEPEWKILLQEKTGGSAHVLREKDIITGSTERAKAMLSVYLDENGDRGYMMFTDWMKDRDFEQEKSGLERLSYIIFRRIRQLEAMQRELEETNYVISHDTKTGLLNYTSFLMQAEQYAKEYPEKRLYLLYSDFSNFQYLNETYGYAAGDGVLKAFAKVLREQSGHGILFGRVTADHFISMHEGIGMEELREGYTRSCREFCEEINRQYELSKMVLVSGICEVDRGQEIFAVNIDNANLARKAVKNKTQTICIPYSVQMRRQSQIQMEMSANMEIALQKGEFSVYMQPKIELATGRLAGAEALVRWVKPDGSVICPDQFIPIFEKNGFITRIDFEMLRQSLAFQKKALKERGTTVCISVNFSRQHQEDPHLVSKIEELLEEYGVPGRYLEAEITESVFLYDLRPLNDNIRRLHERGVKVSIDDFGSGYSSLNVLSKVQADIIKLDRQFLLDMETGRNESPKEFLKMLIDMIKRLGFSVIAEGIETQEQNEILKEAGCQFVQGYYYAKPMPAAEFWGFVERYTQEHGMV